ncbi:MAG: hypothetical protein R3Y26_11875, partial [Rikenellaceae bacterium]
MRKLILLVAVAFFAIQSTNAQSRGGGQQSGQGGPGQEQGQGRQQGGQQQMRISPERLVEKHYKELNASLNFTAEQEVEVRALLTEFYTPNRDKKQAKESDLMKQLKEMLPADKQAALKEYLKEKKKNKLSEMEERLELMIDINVYELDDSLNLSDEQEDKIRAIIRANTELPEEESSSDMGGGMDGGM